MASRSAEADYLNNLHSLTGLRGAQAVPGLASQYPGVPAHQQLAQQRAVQAAQKAKAAVERATAMQEEADHVVNDAAAGEQEDEDLYALYKPAKVHEGFAHPDPIVETASLAGVLLPDPRYKHSLKDIADAKLISDAQLETVVYANDRFAQRLPNGDRAGFFLGDGAGVGKGRQIAALIKDQWKLGHKRCIWISVSTDLRYDAQRDLDDVCAKNIKIVPEGGGTLPKGRLDKAFKSGVLFITYSLLVVGAKHWASKASKNAGEELTTAIDKTSRLHQIIEWLGSGEGDPIIVLDECHKAKNLLSARGASHTGLAVCALQKELPNARVLYSSATGASEPNNLAYMVRLSNAGFDCMKDMITYLRSAGLGSLELYAMGLKATGSYLSRTLSYSGAEFNIAKEKIDPVFVRLYDASTRFWSLLYHVCQRADMGRATWRLFWSAQLRFYRQMLMAAKVPACARLAIEAVQSGMCAVIGLQSTGEANTKAAAELDDVLDDFVSAPQMVLIQFLTKHFPITRPKNSSHAQLDELLGKVFDAVEEWRVHGMESAPPSAAAAAATAHGNSTASAPPAPSEPLQPATQGAAADDGDIELVGEVNEEQAREKKRLEAIQAGRFLDLSEEDGTSERPNPEGTAKSLAKLAEQEEEIAQKERDARLAPLMDRREAALEAVKAAEGELQKASDEAVAKEAAAKEAAGKAGDEAKGAGRLLRRGDSGAAAAAAEGTENGHAKDQVMQEASGGSPAVAAKGRKRVLLLEDSDESENEKISPGRKQAAAAQPRKLHRALSSATEPSAQREGSAPPAKARSAGMGTAVKSSSSPEVVAITQKPQRRSTVAVDSDEDMVVSSPVKPARKAGAAVKQERKPAAVKQEGKKGKKTAGKHKAIGVDSDEDLDRESSEASIASGDESSSRSEDSDSSSEGSDDSDDASDDSEILKQAKRMKLSRAAAPIYARTRTRNSSQLTLQGSMKRAGGKPLSIHEMVARRKVAEAQKELREAEADIEEFELHAAEEATEHYDDDTRSAETGGGSNRSGKKKKRRASPQERKPAMPQYAVKRQELHEGWNEAADEDDDSLDGAEAMVDDDGFDETGDRPPCRQMMRLRKMLLRAVHALELPPNPLDHLTELLGGQEKVAEMTGRQGMLVRQADGTVTYQKRRAEEAQKMVNLREKESFMRGDKLFAIISEAASVGISLQADRRVKNQRRRCHLTLELPWSADKAVQQFGRSHRSNQTSAPIYRIIVTSCGGEYRFAASAAKRLQSLGALLRGDRRALGAGADLKEFDIDNKYGKQALDRACGIICGSRAPLDNIELPELPADVKAMPEEQTHGELDSATAFYRYMQDAMVPVGLVTRNGRGRATPAKPCEVVSSFLNRLLAMPIKQQELLFTFFTDVMDALIAEAKSKGGYDEGIVSIRAQGAKVHSRDVIHIEAASGAKTFHTVVDVNRGLSWEKALEYRDACVAEAAAEGVAVSRNVGFFKESRVKDWGKTGHPKVMVTSDVKRTMTKGQRMVRCQRPNSSIGPPIEEYVLRQSYTKISDAEARKHWEFWYEWSSDKCMHGKECTMRKVGRRCMYGSRLTELHIINGAVLPLLKCLSDTVGHSGYGRDTEGKKPPTRVVRTTLDDGTPLLGLTLLDKDAYLVREKVEAVFGAVEGEASHPKPASHRNMLPNAGANGMQRMSTGAAASARTQPPPSADAQPKPRVKAEPRAKATGSRPKPTTTVIEIE